MSASGVFRVVIPARYGSTRLPGKALLPMMGKPMVQWVHERAAQSKAAEIIIATDDSRIAAVAQAFGAVVAMTAATHASGTDRIAEVARVGGWADDDIVVNVQGDEPLIPPELIDQVAELLQSNASAHMATLGSPLTSVGQLMDPNVVKYVVDAQGRALYFSRAPIPWSRDTAPFGFASQTEIAGAHRHIGIYAYRVGALLKLASLPPTPLELLEKLEQLRALENGFEIRVAEAVERPGPDVNTADDLARVLEQLR
jgi:3-deoxy-manno-octulosonate cytidylyltransferase (CMP-KDO synthetase)